MTQTLETKAQFAARKKRSPSAISNWIAEGKISQAALIGRGIRAKIWVERAEADLAGNLDDGQQLAQDAPANVVPFKPPGAAAGAPPEPLDKDLQRRREADARRASHDADLAELRVNRETGRWVEAEEAQRAWGRELSALMKEIEIFVVQRLTRDIADAHGLDWKMLATSARQSWNEYRAGAAEEAQRRVSALEIADADEVSD